MKLIIGLGNPEEKYKHNRHNVGHMFVDFLNAQELSGDFKVEKTDTFMNQSGLSVRKLVDFYKVSKDDLLVVYDDLDIPLGGYKVQKGRGPRQHNGVSSVEAHIGEDFWHVRIGVDNRDKENRIAGIEYVLQDFTEKEREMLGEIFARLKEEIVKNRNGMF